MAFNCKSHSKSDGVHFYCATCNSTISSVRVCGIEIRCCLTCTNPKLNKQFGRVQRFKNKCKRRNNKSGIQENQKSGILVKRAIMKKPLRYSDSLGGNSG